VIYVYFLKSKAPFILVGGSKEAAYFLRHMTAVFLGGLSGGSLIDWCQKGLAAVFWTRRGGRTDFYLKISRNLFSTSKLEEQLTKKLDWI